MSRGHSPGPALRMPRTAQKSDNDKPQALRKAILSIHTNRKTSHRRLDAQHNLTQHRSQHFDAQSITPLRTPK